MKRIILKTSKVTVEGELNNSQTALKIYEKLPFEAKVNTWGDEVYFGIPLHCLPEDATLDVEIGDIAYWPEGSCLCVFFGRTPASTDNNKPKPASQVNIVGKITTDISLLKNIKAGDKITVLKG
ncbi:MAG: cyclophilin-like fold protein [Candidatus Omnitrophica bacterium]|nr:cyclophilin-like fold protein [Candidatus Omnitrophota bacterium]